MNSNAPPSPTPQSLCAAFAPLLPLLNAAELDPEQAASLRDHLKTCAWCRAQLAGYDVIDSAARRHYAGTPAATPLFQPQEIEKMLDEPTAPQYEPLSARPTVSPPPQPRRRHLPALSAIAAALLVAALAGMFFARQNTTHPGGHITATQHSQGTIVEYSLAGHGKTPLNIIAGADGNLWFTDPGANAVERIAPDGHIQVYAVPTANSGVYGIARAADGILWFTEQNAIRIGSVDASGKITDYPGAMRDERPTAIIVAHDGTIWYTGLTTSDANTDAVVPFVPNRQPKFIVAMPDRNPGGLLSITEGPDGTLWYAESKSTPTYISRIDPTNFLNDPRNDGNSFNLPTPDSEPLSITTGPDGNLWFVERGTNRIGCITPTGDVKEYPVPTPHAGLNSITTGPDGNLWFTEGSANKIGRITPTGEVKEFSVPTPNAGLTSITTGPDGNLWFTEHDAGKIGSIHP
ncbi:MAG: virginiamycin B lyase family protein [Ktedonobacterales bacterium]